MAGTPVTFENLRRRFTRYILAIANRELSPEMRRRVSGSDVAQNVWLRISQKLGTARGTSVTSLQGWVAAITRNEVLGQERVARISRSFGAGELPPALMAAEQPALGDFEGALDEAYKRLDEDQRRLLNLRHCDGKTFSEIGSILGISESTAGRMVRDAERRLRELVESRR